MIKRIPFLTLLLGVACGSAALAAPSDPNLLPLAGEWTFRLDQHTQGIAQAWFKSTLPERIRLPGSTDEAGFGIPNVREANLDHLSRLVEYTGPAWYQREIDIPAVGRASVSPSSWSAATGRPRCGWMSATSGPRTACPPRTSTTSAPRSLPVSTA